MKFRDLKALVNLLSYDEQQKEMTIDGKVLDARMLADGRLEFILTDKVLPSVENQIARTYELMKYSGHSFNDCRIALQDADWDYNKAKEGVDKL